MGYKIMVELFVSEVELEIIRENEINIPRVCVEAIAETLNHYNSLKTAQGAIDSRVEIQRLRDTINRLVLDRYDAEKIRNSQGRISITEKLRRGDVMD